MPGSEWKTFTSAGIPGWVAAVAWFFLAGENAKIISVLLFALSGVGSLALVAARPRMLRLLLVPRGFEGDLNKAAQTALNEKVVETGKVIPDAERVAVEIARQTAMYFQHTFEEIESDFRSGRAPAFEQEWYLLVGSAASFATLMALVWLLAIPFATPLTSELSPASTLVSIATLASLGAVCLLVALASKGRLKRLCIIRFPLLLTSAEYGRLESFAKLAATLEKHGHPSTGTTQMLADIASARTKGLAQRQALVSAVAENTAADPALVTDIVTDFLTSLVALVVLTLVFAVFREVYGKYLRRAAWINLLIGAGVVLAGLWRGSDLEIVLGISFLGPGMGFLIIGRRLGRMT